VRRTRTKPARLTSRARARRMPLRESSLPGGNAVRGRNSCCPTGGVRVDGGNRRRAADRTGALPRDRSPPATVPAGDCGGPAVARRSATVRPGWISEWAREISENAGVLGHFCGRAWWHVACSSASGHDTRCSPAFTRSRLVQRLRAPALPGVRKSFAMQRARRRGVRVLLPRTVRVAADERQLAASDRLGGVGGHAITGSHRR
jgi:hypothetical protein